MIPIIGYGIAFAYGNAGLTNSGGSFTNLAQLADINPPKSKIAKVANDAFDSPTNSAGLPVETFIAGWESPGQATLKLRYDSGGTQAAVVQGLKGLLKSFKITKPDGKGWIYPAMVMEVGEETPLKETVMLDCTIELTGPAIAF